MQREQYKLRRRVAGVSAEVVVAELERHHAAYGGIYAERVVDDARPEDAPLHPAFEWNDGKAAEEYRLYQARTLIRAVHVVLPDGEDGGCVFVNVTTPEQERVYLPVAEVVHDADLFQVALQSLLRKLDEAQRAVDALRRAAKPSVRKKINAAATSLKKAMVTLGSAAE